jgi:hypothetical protein
MLRLSPNPFIEPLGILADEDAPTVRFHPVKDDGRRLFGRGGRFL